MYTIKEKNTTQAVVICETTKTEYKLKCIRTDANFGNFYMFNSILEMPSLRYSAYEILKQMNTLGIDADDLKTDIESIKKIVLNTENPKNGLHEIYNIVAQQENKIKNFWNHKATLLMIVGLLIIHENDLNTIGDFEQDLVQNNIKQWSKDSEMINFFLNCAIQNMQISLQKLEQLSKTNTLMQRD